MQEKSERKDSTLFIVIGIVTLVLALAAVAVLLVIPSVYTLLMSLQKVKLTGSVFNSPWVGLQNYIALFSSEAFLPTAAYTAAHAVFTAVFLFISSLVTGYLLLAVGKAKWLRHALCTLLLIPLILPNELWLQLFISLKLYRVAMDIPLPLASAFLAALCTVKYIGLPALLVSAALSHGRRRWYVPLAAGGAASLVIFALLGRFDFEFLRQLPPTLINLQGLDAMILRRSFMLMQIGPGSAASVTFCALGFFAMAVVAVPVALLIKCLFPSGGAPDGARIKDRLISLAIPGGIAIIAAVVLAAVAFSGGMSGISLYANLPVYLVIALFGATFNTVLCFLLARAAVCGGKALKIIGTAVLLLLTALSFASASMGEYMLFHELRMIGTMFAVAFSGLGAVWGVWPLVFAAKGMGVSTNTDWFKRMWKPSLALLAMQFALMANNTLPSLIYINNISSAHPLLLLEQQLMQASAQAAGAGPIALMLLATATLPVLCLLLVRTALNEKDSLGLFLPGR